MSTTPRLPRPARARCVATAVALGIALACTWPATVSAAPASAANYRLDSLRYTNGTPVGTCRGWGGDSDSAGNFYMGCPVLRDLDGNGTGDVQAPALYQLDPLGTVVQIGWLPAEYAFDGSYHVRDVGVSPDGRTAYVSTGPVVDNLGQHPERHPTTGAQLPPGVTAGSVLRLTRQADGSWLHDPSFKAGPFLISGNYWAARSVDVDGAGRLYVTVNSYVYEISPTTAQVVSAFGGGQTAWPGGPWVEGIDTAKGLSVSADGTTIHVVEQQHHLVQRWNRVGATDWVRDLSFLLGTPSQEGPELCGSNAHFQSPYDVGVDGAGDVYVLDTTCQRIQRFTSAGAFVQTTWTNAGGDDMNHGMAVNWQGSILLPIEEDIVVRLDPPARPIDGGGPKPTCTDRTAPTVTSIEVPPSSSTRRVAIGATATDDCGVTHVRVVGRDRLGTGAWIEGTRLVVPLGGWNGRKSLVVQVRDSAGRIASRRASVVLALPQPTLRARRFVRLTGRSCSTIPPTRRVRGYLLVDRCAGFAGRVVTARRRGGSWTIEVLVPTATARAMYSNAVGPVRIWVVTDSRTRVTGRIGVRRTLHVTGSLVAERNLSRVHAIPVDRVVGR